VTRKDQVGVRMRIRGENKRIDMRYRDEIKRIEKENRMGKNYYYSRGQTDPGLGGGRKNSEGGTGVDWGEGWDEQRGVPGSCTSLGGKLERESEEFSGEASVVEAVRLFTNRLTEQIRVEKEFSKIDGCIKDLTAERTKFEQKILVENLDLEILNHVPKIPSPKVFPDTKQRVCVLEKSVKYNQS
jgi:hypothetical protein